MRTVALVVAAVATASGVAAIPAQAVERPGDLVASFASFPTARIGGLDVAGDGRIVVAGRSQGYPLDHPWVRAYLPNGQPDGSFGGDGTVELEDDRRTVVGALVQADGRVVVAQGGDPFNQPPPPHVVRRLTREGQPDTTFGGDGSIELDLGAVALTDIAALPDGRIVVAGVRADSSLAPRPLVVARLLPDGSPDPSFGSNGVAEVGAASSHSGATVTLMPDGGLLLTARSEGVPLIARLSPDGQPDGSFGGGGLAPVEYGRLRWAREVYAGGPAPPAIVLPSGRIRLGIAFGRPRGRGYGMALVGLTSDGRPDRGFGLRGRALGPRPGPGGESVETAVRDPRGGILVAGGFWNGEEFGFDLHAVIRRFRADGTLDRSFGNRGVVRGEPASGYPVIEQELAFLGDDRLVVAEHSFDGKYGFWAAATVRTLNGGYDSDPPAISIVVRGCRSIGVRIADLSGMDEVVVRAGRRVIRRTDRKRFRARVPDDPRRVTVRATDLAENVSTKRARLPRC